MLLRISLFLLLSTFIVSSQELDSVSIEMQKKLDATSNSNTKLNLLIKYGTYFFKTNPTKSKEFYLKAASIVQKNDLISSANIFNKLGVIYRKEANFSESYNQLQKAKDIYTSIKDTFNIANSSIDLGILYSYLNEEEKELNNYNEAFELAQKIKDTLLIGKYYNLRGNFYLRAKELDSSFLYYTKALNIFEDKKDDNNINIVKNNLSIIYGTEEKHDKAIKLRTEILKFLKKNNDQMGLSIDYYNIAVSHYMLNEFNKSLKYIDSSIIIAKNENFNYRITNAYKLKSTVYAKTKDYKEAYTNSILYKQYSDTIFDIQKQNKIKELELKNGFDIERKELEIRSHKKEIKNNFYIILFSVVLFFSLLISFYVWRNYTARVRIVRDKLEKELLKKEVLAQKIKASESELKLLIADNTMRLEFIKHLSTQIKEDKSSSNSIDVKNYTNTLLLKLQQQIGTESKLSSLQDKMTIINQGFDNKIIELYPTLTKTEREICSFLRLNLSIKEIASIRNSTTDSIKAVRYRIRKKMIVPKNQELENFIQNLTL